MTIKQEPGQITIGWRGPAEKLIASARDLDNERAANAMAQACASATRREAFLLTMDALRSLIEHRCALQVPGEQNHCAEASTRIAKIKRLEADLWLVSWDIACGAP